MSKTPASLRSVDLIARGGSTSTVSIRTFLWATATAISQQHGLLSNDALIIAIMREQGLANLASSDADFDRVTGIRRFAAL